MDILKKILKWIKSNLLFVILVVLFFAILVIRVPYSVMMPGGIIDLGNRVTVYGEKTNVSGSFNMAYVRVSEGQIPYILLGLISDDYEVVKNDDLTYENETIEESDKRDKLLLEQSKDYATVVAMDAADVDYMIGNKINHVVYIYDKADTDLQVGDNLVSCNGKEVVDLYDFKDQIQEAYVGEKLEIVVLRDDKEVTTYATVYEEDGEKYVGISVLTTFNIVSDVEVVIDSKAAESGSSGGFMMSLMVYNAITKQDLTHGKKIVGTGTISLEGEVGEIGGVKYKIMGAAKENADIFFVPEANYEEAIQVKEDKGYTMEIVKVKTLQDAIDYLEALE